MRCYSAKTCYLRSSHHHHRLHAAAQPGEEEERGGCDDDALGAGGATPHSGRRPWQEKEGGSSRTAEKKERTERDHRKAVCSAQLLLSFTRASNSLLAEYSYPPRCQGNTSPRQAPPPREARLSVSPPAGRAAGFACLLRQAQITGESQKRAPLRRYLQHATISTTSVCPSTTHPTVSDAVLNSIKLEHKPGQAVSFP
ncbi:hypothetical protein AAFF_G00190630 [Aldrovandia affinis]|uniref:Uncharacterized protein n=1 Tax=Aldrovandia affinis TaxID=143900 RepID=A0AAD7VX01_9TELE|nr:hypothetical protein AAFF_G00190630 [Aldrovandia affinis]